MAGQKATKLHEVDAPVAVGAGKPRKKNPKKNIADRTLKALTPEVRVELDGRTAAPSELVMWTVPV